jgi:hypothetical protein
METGASRTDIEWMYSINATHAAPHILPHVTRGPLPLNAVTSNKKLDKGARSIFAPSYDIHLVEGGLDQEER